MTPVVLRPLALLAATVAGAALTAAAPAAAASAPASPERPYVVVLRPVPAAQAGATTARLIREEDVSATHRFHSTVQGFSARMDGETAAALRADPGVLAVTPDRVLEAAALVPLAAGDAIPSGVRRVGAAVGTSVREASPANVAVIDTGIQRGHPDLDAVAGKDCTGAGTTADANGHGTHVAGIIGARNDGAGVTGVVPGARLWAVRVLGADGSGLMSSVICGIDWVTSTRTDADPANDIAVANMSLGGPGSPTAGCGRTVGDALHMAICASVAAGVTYVVAAGNSGADEQGFTPAAYPEVLSVTAIADSDGLPGARGGALPCSGAADDSAASYSNYAVRAAEIAHTIAAPGSCIRSTWPGSGYATLSGTSMAAPHVAGLVALCLGQPGAPGPCAGRSPADVIALVRGAAQTASAALPPAGFAGDPTRPIGSRYYGHLAVATFGPVAAVAPSAGAAPAISGTAAVGATLTAAPGSWSGTAPIATTTGWQRCSAPSTCVAIAGATGPTYVPTAADAGRQLRVVVTASNAAGAASAASAPTAAVASPPVSAALPAVTGTARPGARLATSTGTWTGAGPFSYTVQWLRCTSADVATCVPIAGASTSGYTVVSADTGRRLRSRVTARGAQGTATATSLATAAVGAG